MLDARVDLQVLNVLITHFWQISLGSLLYLALPSLLYCFLVHRRSLFDLICALLDFKVIVFFAGHYSPPIQDVEAHKSVVSADARHQGDPGHFCPFGVDPLSLRYGLSRKGGGKRDACKKVANDWILRANTTTT